MLWDKLLSLEVYHFLFVFTRLSAAFLFMPFYSSRMIPRRIRLLFAASLAVLLTPLLSKVMPAAPASVLELFRLLIIEITAGLFLGLFPYILLTAIEVVGSSASQATSFANATAFDPSTNVQSTVISTFLMLTATLLIIVTNLHHVMLGSIIASYGLFPPGEPLLLGDMAAFLGKTLTSAFKYGFQIASPFVILTVILYSSMGVMARLMPQLNIMFIVMPLQVYLGLSLLMISLPLMMYWFIRYFDDSIRLFAM